MNSERKTLLDADVENELSEEEFDFTEKQEEYSFKVFSDKEILELVLHSIKIISAVAEIPATMATVLLNYFKWDKDKLMERLYDGDQEKLFSEAHLNNPFKNDPSDSEIVNSFVECNRFLTWCPSPDCSNIIKVDYVDAKPVTCDCDHTFCFKCRKNWHDPVTCDVLSKWRKRIPRNPNDCPKCREPIEKLKFYKYTVCGNPRCGAKLCSQCLELWATHRGNKYACQKGMVLQTSNRNESDPSFLIYYDGYRHHEAAFIYEKRLCQYIKDNLKNVVTSQLEVLSLKNALDILCSCRQTLMYSYAFAYNLQKNNQLAIFEDNLRRFESDTQFLSRSLQRNNCGVDWNDIKQQIQTIVEKSRYCEIRRKVLLEHVHEGYDKGWWKYSE